MRYLKKVLLPLLLLICGCIAAQAATLTTDKPDYTPGETAILTGAGFLPGEDILLTISILDPVTDEFVVDPYQYDYFQADAAGGFVVEYTVPAEALGMNLLATAEGLTSGLAADVAFTDGNVKFSTLGLPGGVTVNVAVQYGTTTTTVSFTSPGPSSNLSVPRDSVLTYSYPSTVLVGGTTYTLISSSPASGLTVGTGALTITAFYAPEVCESECQNPATTCDNGFTIRLVSTTTNGSLVTFTYEICQRDGQQNALSPSPSGWRSWLGV